MSATAMRRHYRLSPPQAWTLRALHKADAPCWLSILDGIRPVRYSVLPSLRVLERHGLAERDGAGRWTITGKGRRLCEQAPSRKAGGGGHARQLALTIDGGGR